MLGDVGPHDDVSYTGDVSTSVFSMDYYRAKAQEFQQLLNQLDATYGAISATLDAYAGSDNEALLSDLVGMVEDFDAKKTALRLTAEAINAGAAVINGLGGRFPQLSVPGTLGLPPIAVPVATVAAIGTAAALAAWGYEWIRGVNDRLKLEMSLDAQATPEQRAKLAASVVTTDNAVRAADVSIWSQAGSAIKWVAFGILGFLAYQAFVTRKKR